MIKHKTVTIVAALFVAILCVSLFTACNKIDKIEETQVDKVVVWSFGNETRKMNLDDTARFIELYNSSEYAGKGTGEGGTPEFGIHVYFSNGTRLDLNDFNGLGKDFEVSIRNAGGNRTAWYYINSEELRTFVSELTERNSN